jgi:hypothetical protein
MAEFMQNCRPDLSVRRVRRQVDLNLSAIVLGKAQDPPSKLLEDDPPFEKSIRPVLSPVPI